VLGLNPNAPSSLKDWKLVIIKRLKPKIYSNTFSFQEAKNLGVVSKALSKVAKSSESESVAVCQGGRPRWCRQEVEDELREQGCCA
jgi:hypothetical protein